MVIVVLGFTIFAFQNNLIDNPNSRIFHYQIEKLSKAGAAHTVFVGDSSLGTLLDVEAWMALSGKPALQLALTGDFGYAGSNGMIARALRDLQPTNIVIFHTVDMMSRDVSPFGQALAYPDDGGLPASAIRFAGALPAFYLNATVVRAAIRGIAMRLFERPDHLIAGDYLRVRNQIGAQYDIAARTYANLRPDAIKARKVQSLREIRKLCDRRELNCVYAHGPLFSRACATVAEYILTANNHIQEVGFDPVAGTPVCVPQRDLADTIDHIRPDRKAHYTTTYYRLISPHLR